MIYNARNLMWPSEHFLHLASFHHFFLRKKCFYLKKKKKRKKEDEEKGYPCVPIKSNKNKDRIK